ncbi:NAD(P)/FAD-dependent oxidoreductase [Arthrobacter bambusae]|uniref:NAD(P)/FAD-dependent oxidoreductase n=1 Tax=Arthrobacter bambusae TaxID=1338426 RepID=UPI002788E6C4|nr:FAD-dependent oxidoreductase [Arthrobacter bambusae]MDQ0029584.1 NADPH-dependent 2,4-dienoyl-CoA reductase/sulfur reductase-like enzyme [Arthrobacter bambusae]MDQ0097244.1 NADPH-dependent 2,4-dienoyl-CoA reductase/sulfur reductase-like enzyme [Arthrobacter bambusae]
METLAIVGASLAGLSAARAARAQGFSGRLLIIGDEQHRPYDRPPLSKEFLAGKIGIKHVMLEDGEAGGDDPLQAEWLLGSPARSFDAATRTITLGDGRTVAADGVVIATGASARTLPELAGLANVFTLRTLQDAQDLAPELVAGGRLLVVGAGFIGAEVASTAKGLGMDVTIICKSEVPLSAPLGPEMAAVMATLHGINGVELICDTGIDSYYSYEGNVTGVRLSDGQYRSADVVLLGIGAVPNVGWLTDSGVELDDGVACDSMGRTNVPGVVAVGDCAAWFDERNGRRHRVEHWTGAQERAALAVAALLDHSAAPLPLNVPYFWSEQYGVTLQFAGHARDAERVEIEAGQLENHSFLAVYYRGVEPVGVLGVNQPRLFTRWRRQLNARHAPPVLATP